MKNIYDYLRDKYGKWGWMGQRAHDASGINRLLPLDFIISCDYGVDVPYYFREEDVFSVEKIGGVRKDWSNEDLNASLQGLYGQKIFDRWNKEKKPVNLLCYRSVGRLENEVRQLKNKPRIYAMPERLKRNLDNKVALYRALPKLSLPRIPGKVAKPGDFTFNALRKELKVPFVVQFPYGSSGHFTFIVREESEYNKIRKKYPTSTVIIREYVEGFSLNVNAVIVSGSSGPKVVCSFPSVQITGLPECSNFMSAFCGNDYAAANDVDKSIIREVERQVERVGLWMAEKGYRGVFGMDFMVADDSVCAVEINPRFQNSTSLFASLSAKIRSKKRTMFMLHIAEFLQGEDKVLRDYVQTFPFKDLMSPVIGSQIVVHNRMQEKIVSGELMPGVYSFGEDKLTLKKPAATLDKCKTSDDVLITCGVPRSSARVEPNAPVCKIQMLKNVMNLTDKQTLTEEAKGIVADVYNKLALQSVQRAGVRSQESEIRK